MITISKKRYEKIACKEYRTTLKRGDEIVNFNVDARVNSYDLMYCCHGSITHKQHGIIYLNSSHKDDPKQSVTVDQDGSAAGQLFSLRVSDMTEKEHAEFVTIRLST